MHDIAYSKNKDSSDRYQADKELQAGAIKRLLSKDAGLGERAASLLVSTAMKAKTGLSKFGMGLTKKESKKNTRKSKKKKKSKSGMGVTLRTQCGVKKTTKKASKGKPRIIKTPRIVGGVLPLLPILAGIGALGSVIGSATGVVRTLKDIKSTKEMLLENARHNRAMENKIKGAGLYLKPYSRSEGNGLYLKPYSNSKNSH